MNQTDRLQLHDKKETVQGSQTKFDEGKITPQQQVFIKDFNKLDFDRNKISKKYDYQSKQIFNRYAEFDFSQDERQGPREIPALTKVLEEDGLLEPQNLPDSLPDSATSIPKKPLGERTSAGPSMPSSLYSINFKENHVMDTERNALKNPRLNEHPSPENKTSAGKKSNAFMFAAGALKSDRVQMQLQKGGKGGRHGLLPDQTYQNIKYRNQLFDLRAGLPRGEEIPERVSQISSVSKAVDSLLNQYEREFNLPDQRTDYSPLDGGPSVIQEGSETVGNKELGSTKSPDRLLTTRQSQSHSDEKAGTTSRGVVERRKGAQPVAPWRGDRQLIRIEGAPPSSSGRQIDPVQNQGNVLMTGNQNSTLFYSTQFQQTPASAGLSPKGSDKKMPTQCELEGKAAPQQQEQARTRATEPAKVVYSHFRRGPQMPVLQLLQAASPQNPVANQKQLQKQIIQQLSIDFQRSMNRDRNGVGKLYQSLDLPKNESEQSDLTDPLTFRDKEQIKHPKRKTKSRVGPRQFLNNSALIGSTARNAQTTMPGRRNRLGAPLPLSIRDEASTLPNEEKIEAVAGSLHSTTRVANLDLSQAVHVWNQTAIQKDTERRQRRMKGEQTPPCQFRIGKLAHHIVADRPTSDVEKAPTALQVQGASTLEEGSLPLESLARPFSQQPNQPRACFSSKMSERPETHDLNLRRSNIFSQQQRARLQRLGGQGRVQRDAFSGSSNFMPLSTKHFGAQSPTIEPDLGFAQNWPHFHQLRNSNLLSQSLNLNGLISIQGAIEQQITKRPALETKRNYNQRKKISLPVANKDELREEELVQKIDTNCQTDGVESTKNSMQKTQDSKFAQLTCRNEPSSRAQAQPLKMKTAFNNTKKGRGTGKKRFGIQGNAISKQTKDDDKQGVAAVSVPQVKNSIDDIIDLKIDHELQSILLKSQKQDEDVANGEEESFRRRKTITVRGYPLTGPTPLEMSKVDIDKVNLVKEEPLPSRPEQVPKNQGSCRTSQASCHSGAQELKQKFSIHQSDQQGFTSRKINDRGVSKLAADKEITARDSPKHGQQVAMGNVPQSHENVNQKTEPHIKEGNIKRDTSVSGPNFLSDEQRKEREESKLQIKEELASESAEAPGAESRGRQTIVRAELKTSAEVAGADPFLQTVTFETKEEPSGAYQKPLLVVQGRVPEIALKNLKESDDLLYCQDSSQRRSLLVNQSVLDSARSRNQSQRSKCSRINCNENTHHYQMVKDYINIQYQKYEREGQTVIANHAKMVPPSRTLKNTSFDRYRGSIKRYGTYELSDKYSIDPFTVKEELRSQSPNFLKNIALAQSPRSKIDKIQISPGHSVKAQVQDLTQFQVKAGHRTTLLANGQSPFEVVPRKGATTRDEKKIIMSKIQVRDGRVKQREPQTTINNADLVGLQNPGTEKPFDSKKLKNRKLVMVSPGGNAKIKNEKIPKAGGFNSIDVTKLTNYEIIQNTIGSGSLKNPSTSRLQNVNSQRTDRRSPSPQKSIEHPPTLSIRQSKERMKEKEEDDPQLQRARQFMESKISNFKKSLRMSFDNKIDYQNQPRLYKQRFNAVNRKSMQAKKQGNESHRKQVRQIFNSLHRQKNRVRQSADRAQLDQISLLDMDQMKTRVKNISKLSPIREQIQQQPEPHFPFPQTMGFFSPAHNLAQLQFTCGTSNSDVQGGYSIDDSASVGSKDGNLFILMPLTAHDKLSVGQSERIEDQFLKKRKIQPVPMNESQEVMENREKFEIKKQLGRKYFKKFIKKIDDTDVLEMIMEQGRAGTVKASDRDSQLTSQQTQHRERIIQKKQERETQETQDQDDASKLQTALAKYEDTASYQKKFLYEENGSLKVDTNFLSDPEIPSRDQITITNSSALNQRNYIKSFDSQQQTQEPETSMNNDILHIKQVKKFKRQENTRKLTAVEVKRHCENYLQMQQLLQSNSSEEKGVKMVHNIPDLSMVMELDQHLSYSHQSKPSGQQKQISNSQVQSFSEDPNSPSFLKNQPQNIGQTYNAVIIPLNKNNLRNQINQVRSGNPLDISPTFKQVGTGFVPLKQSNNSNFVNSNAESPVLYEESPILSRAFIDKQAIKYTYQTMAECMQKRKLEGTKQVATLPISVNTQTVNANTMTISKKNSTMQVSNEFLNDHY